MTIIPSLRGQPLPTIIGTAVAALNAQLQLLTRIALGMEDSDAPRPLPQSKRQARNDVCGRKPWHRLGMVLEEPPPTAEGAITAAHLTWRVGKKQLYVGEERRPFPGESALLTVQRYY